MSNNRLKRIESFDNTELREFLKNNGMNDCLKLFESEIITGETFLNLSKSDFIRLKKGVAVSILKKVDSFIKKVKQNPEKFTIPNGIPPPTGETFSVGSTDFRKKLGSNLGNENNRENQKNLNTLQEKDNENKYQCVTKKLEEETQQYVNVKSINLQQKTKSKYLFNMNRDQAENCLMALSKNGTYLFRLSSQYHFALSVLYQNKVYHFGISVNGNNLEMQSGNDNIQVDSFEDMVNYFRQKPLLMAEGSQNPVILDEHFLTCIKVTE